MPSIWLSSSPNNSEKKYLSKGDKSKWTSNKKSHLNSPSHTLKTRTSTINKQSTSKHHPHTDVTEAGYTHHKRYVPYVDSSPQFQ